jgi:CRISPR system Cascade subunit CasA
VTGSFNLIDEPWIDVQLVDGQRDLWSIRDCLARGSEVRSLVGEVPTQQVAIIRLLLAILLRAIPVEGDPAQTWGRVWADGKFDSSELAEYLDSVHHRFDLFDPTQPFMQVADLHTAKGEFTSLARLIVDVPAGKQYLTTRTPASYQTLSFAEAARWLTHASSFDPSGIKSGAIGDSRVKGGKGYPIGVGFCGWLGVVMLQGRNLFETLMLNLTLEDTNQDDKPVWERAQLTAAEEREEDQAGMGSIRQSPRGPADLLTWPSRRIRLVAEDGWVTSVLLCNGDALHPRNLHRIEPMSAWRQSDAQAKITGEKLAYMPRSHLPDRQIWLGLAGMLGGLVPSGERSGLAARNVGWLRTVVNEGHLPAGFPVTTRAYGLEYGTQSAVVVESVNDALLVQAAFFALPRLQAGAVRAVEAADGAAKALGDFARDLVRSAGGDQSAPADQARTDGYAVLDLAFRQWVAALDDDTDLEVAQADWQTLVWQRVSGLAWDLTTDISPAAYTGRASSDGRPIDPAIALRHFFSRLTRALPNRRKEPTDGSPR